VSDEQRTKSSESVRATARGAIAVMEAGLLLICPRASLLGSRIFRGLAGGTIALALACAAARPPITAKPTDTTTGDPTRTYTLNQVLLLHVDSLSPHDTTVKVRRGQLRVIVILHPDELSFADLTLPAQAFDSTAGDSVTVTIHIHPGLYGLDLTTSAPLREGSLTFKYPVHFSAPADARAAFGSDVAFERVLAIGKLGPNQTIVFQRSTRPATDNLSTALTSAGSYVVGAPK
jgi:hypothetical protein